MYELYIANKNYSSWSLRPWVLMRMLGIPFAERLIVFGDTAAWQNFRRLNPSGRVPCLIDGGERIWDSLAITEYLAEGHAAVWPQARAARTWARCAAAEMHSGFFALREQCSMSCGVRVRLHALSESLEQDRRRIVQLWQEGLTRFGGPYLAGAAFSAVDAFYAPVAFRAQSYGLVLEGAAGSYAERLLGLPPMQDWYRAALEESARDESHEAELRRSGTLRQDLRRGAAAR